MMLDDHSQDLFMATESDVRSKLHSSNFGGPSISLCLSCSGQHAKVIRITGSGNVGCTIITIMHGG